MSLLVSTSQSALELTGAHCYSQNNESQIKYYVIHENRYVPLSWEIIETKRTDSRHECANGVAFQGSNGLWRLFSKALGHGAVKMRLGEFEPYGVTSISQISDSEDLCSRKDFSRDNMWAILLKQDGPYRIPTKSKNYVSSGLRNVNN